MFKVNNKYRRRSGVFLLSTLNIFHTFFLIILLLTLSKYTFATIMKEFLARLENWKKLYKPQ